MKNFLFLTLACLVSAKGKERRICFAPVVCSVGETSTTEWLEFDPERQCENKYSAESNDPNMTSNESGKGLNEIQVKNLIEKNSGVIRSESENLAYSLFNKTDEKIKLQLKGELENLKNTLKQTCFNPDYQERRLQVLNLRVSIHNKTDNTIGAFHGSLDDLNATLIQNAEDLQSQVINFTRSKFNGSTEQQRELETRLETLNSTTEQNLNLLHSYLESVTYSLFNKTEKKLGEIQKMEKTIKALREKKKTSDSSCQDVNGTFYLGKCFWVIVHSAKDVSVSRAETLCAAGGGEPGDFLDGFHYNMISGMTLASMPTSHTWVHVLTGMTYNSKDKVLSKRDGREAFYKQWLSSGHPKSNPSRTRLFYKIDRDSASGNGMFNSFRSYSGNGILCQK